LLRFGSRAAARPPRAGTKAGPQPSATGGALVLVSFDVSRWIPVIVEGTIRYTRPVTGPITCDLSLTDDERDLVDRALELDPKTSWTLMAAAVDEDGRIVCEADLVYRFRTPG
jgi:hypothetical protein